MLNKFQEQDLFASVEKLEDIKKEIDKTISIIKNIKPSLFSYPQVAKYTTEEFDSTIVEKDDEQYWKDYDNRGEMSGDNPIGENDADT